jgi:hypothetical protein
MAGTSASRADIAARAAIGARVARPARPHRDPRARLFGKIVLFLMLASGVAGYLASPLIAAHSIRDAVARGHSDYLRDRIDWPQIQQTLKSSMTTYALGSADASSGSAVNTAEVEPPSKPSFWQRLKQGYGRRVVHGMVDSYVTPESLPKLFAYRESYHETVGSVPVEPEATTWSGKIAREWRRLKRAEFLSPTRFAVEVQDRFTPGKSIAGELELRASGAGIGWHLVSLEVKGKREAVSMPRAMSGAWSRMKQAALPATARTSATD